MVHRNDEHDVQHTGEESAAVKRTLFERARAVLDSNWVDLADGGGFTRPAADLYPFQWNWDSGFIAYGYSHYNVPRGIAELRTLFKGQWQNGFLPHIVFHGYSEDMRDAYFPGPEFWNVRRVSKKAPCEIPTSGVTHPPMQALAVWHLYKVIAARDPDAARELVEEFYPCLYRMHKYLHTVRDPERWGLVTIFHPWESGFDNSPRWDEAMKRIVPKEMAPYRRVDTKYTNPAHRPTDAEYDRFIYLAQLLRDGGYNDAKAYATHPFKIKDKVFSSILYLADQRLRHMAEVLSKDTEEVTTWMDAFREGLFSKLWDEEENMFCDYDVVARKQVPVRTIAAMLPLVTGLLSSGQITAMSGLLSHSNFCGESACAVDLIPTVGIKEKHFDHDAYWRGPVWLNINWFLWRGFRHYSMYEQAEHLRAHILSIVADKGFCEYYSPITGEGLGTQNFSWSAALVIDLLHKEVDIANERRHVDE